MEFLLVYVMLNDEGVSSVFGLSQSGDWAICDVEGSDSVGKELAGVGGLYSYGVWLVLITGWSLLIAVMVIMEVTRGG